jgi:hypothetical protein
MHRRDRRFVDTDDNDAVTDALERPPNWYAIRCIVWCGMLCAM